MLQKTTISGITAPPNSRLRGADARTQLAQHGGDFLERLRPAEQIAPHLDAAFGAQDLELLLGLDALGRGDPPETRAEPRHRADDRDAIVFLAELADEGAVDLDLVEREAAQIAERRIAGAEIVHADAHAEIA